MATRFAAWFDRLPDAVHRGLRTFAQVFAAEVIVTVVKAETVLMPLATWIDTLDGGVVAGLAGLIAYGVNAGEDRGIIPVVGKTPPIPSSYTR